MFTDNITMLLDFEECLQDPHFLIYTYLILPRTVNMMDFAVRNNCYAFASFQDGGEEL